MRVQWWDKIEPDDVQMNVSTLFLYAYEDAEAAREIGVYGNAYPLHVTNPPKFDEDLGFVRRWLAAGRAVVMSSEILAPITHAKHRVFAVMAAMADLRDEASANAISEPAEVACRSEFGAPRAPRSFRYRKTA